MYHSQVLVTVIVILFLLLFLSNYRITRENGDSTCSRRPRLRRRQGFKLDTEPSTETEASAEETLEETLRSEHMRRSLTSCELTCGEAIDEYAPVDTYSYNKDNILSASQQRRHADYASGLKAYSAVLFTEGPNQDAINAGHGIRAFAQDRKNIISVGARTVTHVGPEDFSAKLVKKALL